VTSYLVYDEATGRLIRWGKCAPADAPRQALFPGETVRVFDGELDPSALPTLEELDA
jgi:hypothetical protein